MPKATKTPETANTPATTAEGQPNQLFASVDTYNIKGDRIGHRVVDMYHYGTRNWLQNHMWWAMHNGHGVETQIATDDEVKEYITEQAGALAAKFNAPAIVA